MQRCIAPSRVGTCSLRSGRGDGYSEMNNEMKDSTASLGTRERKIVQYRVYMAGGNMPRK